MSEAYPYYPTDNLDEVDFEQMRLLTDLENARTRYVASICIAFSGSNVQNSENNSVYPVQFTKWQHALFVYMDFVREFHTELYTDYSLPELVVDQMLYEDRLLNAYFGNISQNPEAFAPLGLTTQQVIYNASGYDLNEADLARQLIDSLNDTLLDAVDGIDELIAQRHHNND